MTNKDNENNAAFKTETLTDDITTIDQLAQSLALHTRLISDEIIMPALKQSKEYKPIIEFFHSVQKHLIHSPDEPEPKKVILATEDTELKKNLLSVNSVRSVAKNNLPVKRRKLKASPNV
jgi:hypothetical protein